MKFIIKTLDNLMSYQTEYIGSGTYIVNGEKYAVVVGTDISLARRYSSYARAENSIKKLMETCCNMTNTNYEIIGVED